MAIPVLQQNGTRIVRVTVTLINNTGRPQRAKTWSLTACGVPEVGLSL